MNQSVVNGSKENRYLDTFPVSLAPLTLLDVSPINRVIIAAEVGYSHIGLRLIPATQTGPCFTLATNPQLIKQIAYHLQQTGIQVLDIEVLRLKSETRIINFLPILEAGAQLGAKEALVTGNDSDNNRLADNFSLLCELAAPFNLAVNIEPTPWTHIPDIKSAAALLKKTNQLNQGLVIDPLHFDRSTSCLSDLKSIPKRYFRYMQLCDGTKVKPNNMEDIIYQARNHRLSPGHGGINLTGLLRAIPRMPISIECYNSQLAQYTSPMQRAKMYFEDTQRLLSSLFEKID